MHQLRVRALGLPSHHAPQEADPKGNGITTLQIINSVMDAPNNVPALATALAKLVKTPQARRVTTALKKYVDIEHSGHKLTAEPAGRFKGTLWRLAPTAPKRDKGSEPQPDTILERIA